MINNFDEVFRIMDEAFPNHEIRTYKDQKNLLDNDKYNLIIEYNENKKIIGIMAVWEFEKFSFIEHLVVTPLARGTGIGTKMIEQYISKRNGLVFLEVEPQHDEISKRRINFYERLGFHLNDFYYEQPPLRKGLEYCELKIMSYPKKIIENEFLPYKKSIYQTAYKINIDNTKI